MTEKKTIGIIGGMGPLATADLFRKIILNTKAGCDQEHIKVLIDNNTDIPDRTACIINNGLDPVPQLTKSALSLWAMGAQLLVMPCNTAHFFYPRIQKAVEIPVLHMIDITANTLAQKGIKKAGLLATDGTLESGIYQNSFQNTNMELLVPNKADQAAIMDMIYHGVKAGKADYDATRAKETMADLLDKGAEILILGCTELPLAMEMYSLDFPACDPTLELARHAIQEAGGVCV